MRRDDLILGVDYINCRLLDVVEVVSLLRVSKFYGQATKGARRMPWQKQAMKDVASCDKLRGAAHRRYIRRSPNGETHLSKPQEHPAEYIGRSEQTQGSEPSQYLEEEKETSIPIVVASELGIAQTRSISVQRGL